MFQELTPDQFREAGFLFRPFDYSLSIQAAIDGNNPGRIFVDDISNPRAALGLTVEGYLLAGESDDPEIVNGLRQLIEEEIFTGKIYVNGDWSMSLAVHPQSWERRLPELIPTHEVEKIERCHFLCHEMVFNWRDHIPEGYTIKQVDRDLLDNPGLIFPDPLSGWIDFEQLWWSRENFLSHGISFVALQGNEVAAWCTPDCFSGSQMDVGIITHPAHRRRGLASVAVAATVEDCLKRGFEAVGWHYNADNIGSQKTAEKVGFKLNRKYNYYYYIYDPVDHLAELGWNYYRRGEYDRTVQYYEKVFAQREENPDYYYHLTASAYALLGKGEKSLAYLHDAARAGWANVDWTRSQKEFEMLHDLPEWAALLKQMENK